MANWEIVKEQASIVLVGNFNPRIFSPDWFIRKGIVEEWDYSDDDISIQPDYSKIEFPNKRVLSVFLNKFSVASSLASDYSSLKDFVVHTLSILSETPIQQIGMNYSAVIKIDDSKNWSRFASGLAPKEPWKNIIPGFAELADEKKDGLGLWTMTMHIPRLDDYVGFIHPTISVVHVKDRVLSFSINNHIDIKEDSATEVVAILDESWENSIDLAKALMNNTFSSQLG